MLGHKLRTQPQGISYSLSEDGTEESFFFNYIFLFYCLYIQQIVKSSISGDNTVPIRQLHFFNDPFILFQIQIKLFKYLTKIIIKRIIIYTT